MIKRLAYVGLFAVLLTASCVSSAPPSKQDASQPAGAWRCWVFHSQTEVLASDGRHIWFGGSCRLWRYDQRTSQIVSFGPLDRVGPYGVTDLLPDGRLIMTGNSGSVLWDGRRWLRHSRGGFDGKGEIVGLDHFDKLANERAHLDDWAGIGDTMFGIGDITVDGDEEETIPFGVCRQGDKQQPF